MWPKGSLDPQFARVLTLTARVLDLKHVAVGGSGVASGHEVCFSRFIPGVFDLWDGRMMGSETHMLGSGSKQLDLKWM